MSTSHRTDRTDCLLPLPCVRVCARVRDDTADASDPSGVTGVTGSPVPLPCVRACARKGDTAEPVTPVTPVTLHFHPNDEG